MAKVYVASSWSNEHQPRIVAFLRERGHEVYDFRNPERKTDFRWSQISGNWEKMETDEYLDALEHPLVEAGFRSDFDGHAAGRYLCACAPLRSFSTFRGRMDEGDRKESDSVSEPVAETGTDVQAL